ncbi:NAD-glutamate dehydrogenase [Sphingomicrobium clamense]|uniref:NAD-glutamate dehydrogenase n=1 Tax=Sphingomicrobium clamense TaxID=2851013 RepID=A0ABS6V3R8_9SPHN|nr:NAD-glutamate dehydrogenase domain-containing protein [Sphingomicrobium sp. B8]MBW0144205.1 NAD-glutamate dehydrogenase [Sphingomicrobium sp. B8]
MTSAKPVDEKLADTLIEALRKGALPGDLEDLDKKGLKDAARFVADTATSRKKGQLALALESVGGDAGHRRMRLALVNDDMPFLVDSIAGAIAAKGLAVHRLLHPILNLERDKGGKLKAVGEGNPESLIYVELDRTDSRGRHDLSVELREVLAHVRAAVGDWKKMRAEMEDDAKVLSGSAPEASALLDWLRANNFTLLGHADVGKNGKFESGLGILRDGLGLWDETVTRSAIEAVGKDRKFLIMKADRVSPVHRRVPLDVIMIAREDGGVSVHAGLWTSAALRAPAEEVPILRKRLKELDEELGFSPSSHGGKALTHAISTLPHDLVISFDPAEVREAALVAMSLADRPRPTLLMLEGAIRRHLYAFVWLPRDELSTSRRKAIQMMLEDEVGSPITSWAVELGDGELALLRFTMATDPSSPMPDVDALDEALVEMVRGWAPAVENELIEAVGPGRATRLALTYLPSLPEGYRTRTEPVEGALDILRISSLPAVGDKRDARLYRSDFDGEHQLHLKTYRRGGLIALSDAVPVLEDFGFRVLEEIPTSLSDGALGYIHNFHLELPHGTDVDAIFERREVVERAIADVMAGNAENDEFNRLIMLAGLEPQAVVWLRAWFRYLRQTGVAFGLATVVDALARSPKATQALIDAFAAMHNPKAKGDRDAEALAAFDRFDAALAKVKAIDDDRIFRLMRSVVAATLRTNAFADAANEALAFKIDSKAIPTLPKPVPWREIWVYSPRIEGIHLRGGPIARGGLRWSDRRDDFRTEILGLVKAQMVKNAVIVPTGAKGGFYAKQLPNPAVDRDAWWAEGTESYRIFIRSLLSITDNIVDEKVVHPSDVVIHDGEDPYFVVAADKGTATFSDVANAIALDRNFWLGDAFASGGSNGYDHKAMGITARGAWVSVQRHFLEMGIDVQEDPITVVGVGDMSGDVFGNGMLLSKAIKLVAAFDHRHIFIDPDPDPAESWKERKRLFELPRSSWDDYDREKLSRGGMIVPRDQKEIKLTKAVQKALGIEEDVMGPRALMSEILRAQSDLLWFGGIGTYVKATSQSHADVGDPANDAIRVDAPEVGAQVIGEGANLGITQAARIEYALHGGRINTDFIDNSAGVDCSDNEVNIKIPLNRKMREGKLTEKARNKLLAEMTDEVAAIVLEDNRLQALALSIAEARGANGLPGYVRTIEMLESAGRLDRKVEGLANSDALLRRAQDNRGLTRPELAVLLSSSKIALQEAAEKIGLSEDEKMVEELHAAFPPQMIEKHREAVDEHRLENEILATKVANRLVNRLGPSTALDMTEEEGAALGQVAAAFLVAERMLDLRSLWEALDTAKIDEQARIALFAITARTVRVHLSDILRSAGSETRVAKLVDMFCPGFDKISEEAPKLIRAEVRAEADARREELAALGADKALIDRLVQLYQLDGIFGLSALAARKSADPLALTDAYTKMGEVLGLDWAQQQLARFVPGDQWERLLVAGLARDFEQLRIDFLSRLRGDNPVASVDRWVDRNEARIEQFGKLIDRARISGSTSSAMLAQIAQQARILLGR